MPPATTELLLMDAPAAAGARARREHRRPVHHQARPRAARRRRTRPRRFPTPCVLDEKRERLYVSLWAQAAVAVIDTATFKVVARWTAEEHPNEMLLSKDGKRLFVANANRNSVSVLDTATGQPIETLVAELQPGAAPGNTPNSLALTPDEKLLFVANANINTVAVFDIATPGKSASLGFIPVGWYPTSVRVTADGKKLLVANGKGVISKPNRSGPQPGQHRARRHQANTSANFSRAPSRVIDLPAGDKLDAQLKTWSARAFSCIPRTEAQIAAQSLDGNPIPRKVGDPSPIKYVFYIIKENRTYDQVLGDMTEGNGDPTLCLFPEAITPNHHALAREFVLLDNFYVESEVSADGHEWTMGAYATDFVEKTWPLSYGHNKSDKFPYPAEGNLRHRHARRRLPLGSREGSRRHLPQLRRMGQQRRKTPKRPAQGESQSARRPLRPALPQLRPCDYPDVKRAARFISELQRFENEGDMPRLQIIRLPNDHTSGASPGKPTPTAHVADNDLAFGQVVEAI